PPRTHAKRRSTGIEPLVGAWNPERRRAHSTRCAEGASAAPRLARATACLRLTTSPRLPAMRQPPERIERLPEQYFTRLLASVATAAAAEGERLVDLGRGNPEVGPPEHVVRALAQAAARPEVHGYAPFSGLPDLKRAIASRYARLYGVEL